MKYTSTRGVCPAVPFKEALLSGYAPDGGLYLPEKLPCFTRGDFKSWASLSYSELVSTLLPHFISDEEMTSSEIKGMRCVMYHR